MPPQSSGGHASWPSVQTGYAVFGSTGSRFSRTRECSQLSPKIVRVNRLGADPAEDPGETYRSLAFHGRHSHEPVFRVGPPDAPLANGEFMHVAVLPPNHGLQHVV